MNDRYTKNIKKGFIIFCSIVVIAPFITVVIYEDLGIKNLFVIFSKRAVAETAAFIISVYDPYIDNIKRAILSPARRIDDTEESLDSKQKILDFIGSDLFLRSHLKMERYDNFKIVRSNFNFLYQPFDEPKLNILRNDFRLDDIIREGKDDFEKILILAMWVNKQWEYGFPKNVDFNFNAIDILKRATGKGEHFFCSEYATVFIQCALSLGFQGRYVGLDSHVVSEIWIDEYGKWVAVDPTFCIYFKDKETLLNCLEIHNALIDGRTKEVEVVEFSRDKSFEIDREKLFKNYKNFYIRMRNDWFTNRFPHWYPLSNSIMNGVEWSDNATDNLLTIARETNRVTDIYWTLNETAIILAKDKVEKDYIKFKVILDTVTPNFSHFNIRINERSFTLKDRNILEWVLNPGKNIITANTVNKFGKEGKESQIEFMLYD